MKKTIFFLILLLSISFTAPGASFPREKPNPTIIRVAIIDDRESISLSLKGKYKIYASDSGRLIMEGPFLSAKVKSVPGGLEIGRRSIAAPGIKIKVARDGNIYVDNRRFRGDMEILRKEGSKLMAINHLPIDKYLYGVLYHEVSHRWPMEALKAQAVVARTFALYQARQNKTQAYDLTCDIYSQVYGGRTSEKWSTNRAVNITKDKVLVYNKDIFPAYYHATCGGRTEDASNLWNIDIPPLKGVLCLYCTRSPYYKWKKNIPLSLLEKKLNENGYKIGSIASFTILSKDKSDRVDKLEIKDGSGVAVVLTGKDFRQTLGPNELRSTCFSASVKGADLVINGFGWGHGVGMCQWGAYGMSRRGNRMEEILKHYYPGAEITTVDKIKNKP